MATKLIELNDGILVEVEARPDEAQQISGGLADKVQTTFSKIRPLITNVCQTIVATFENVKKSTDIEKAEVEMGIGLEGEGNLYITKTKATANIVVRLVLKPRGD